MQIPLPITYRGWSVHHDFVGYGAYSDNYDADWLGEELGWQDNGERVWAPSLPDLYYEIDIKIEEGAK
jgi:hypothetical protein